ncbi:MAG: elongation factor P [Candidatus Omnitrophica bacterium]|nr:elongation factor P [Candidatus Omnitrophota bacterium]
MIQGTDVHEGMLLLIDGKVYKVISAALRGSAQAHKIMHLGLRSIPDGHFIEKTYNPGEKVEQILPDRYQMQYLYTDGKDYYFMNTESFEQFAVPAQIVGNIGLYLKENATIQVEFYKGNPINIVFPKTVELKVVSCPPGLHEGTDTTFKEAVLENGIKTLVPQFIKEGDTVKLDVESGKYLDRIKK